MLLNLWFIFGLCTIAQWSRSLKSGQSFDKNCTEKQFLIIFLQNTLYKRFITMSKLFQVLFSGKYNNMLSLKEHPKNRINIAFLANSFGILKFEGPCSLLSQYFRYCVPMVIPFYSTVFPMEILVRDRRKSYTIRHKGFVTVH